MPETIERRIIFYRARFIKDDEAVDPSRLFSRLNRIPLSDPGRCCPRENGNTLIMTNYSSTMPIRACMATVRMRDLPLKYLVERGEVTPLDLTDADGLYEPTHFVVFPMVRGYNVIGFEMTGYGPRPSALKLYMTTILGAYVDDIQLVPLLRRDISEMINRIGRVDSFTMSIARDLDAELEALGRNTRRMFQLLKEDNPDTQYFTIQLKPEKYSRAGLHIPLLQRLPDFISREEVRPHVRTLKAQGRNVENEKEEFNFLDPYLLSKKQVIKEMERYRCVDSTSMFIAIEDSHRDLIPEINRILRVGERN